MITIQTKVQPEHLTAFKEQWSILAETSIFGFPIATQYGGSGKSYQETADYLIKFGEHHRDNGLLLAAGAHLWAGIMPIFLFGTEAQKTYYLPELIRGTKIIAHGITEQLNGSDLQGIKTTARKFEQGYVITGQKYLITNAPVADIFLVLAKVGDESDTKTYTSFILHRDTPGLQVSESISKMGLHTAQMGSITMHNCFVPKEQVLGQPSQGQSIFLKTMELERSMILAPAIGRMIHLHKIALERLRTRRKQNADISHHQYVQEKIVDLELSIEISRNMLASTTHKLDQGKFAMSHASMTKLIISKHWELSASAVMSVFGGHGYLADNLLEQELRDAIGSRYYSGTDEIQKNTIYSLSGLQY